METESRHNGDRHIVTKTHTHTHIYEIHMRHMDTYGDLEDQLSHWSHGSEMSCAAHFVAPAEKAADYTEIGDGLVAQADGRKKIAVRCSDAGLRFNSSSGPVGKAVAGQLKL